MGHATIMKNQEQIIAIGEAMGWTKCRLTIRGAGGPRNPSPYGFPPGRNYETSLPNYLNDLNAMAEVEQILDIDQQYVYGELLAQMIRIPENAAYGEKLEKKFPFNGWGHFSLATMTAAERAEAFLRVTGRWKNE